MQEQHQQTPQLLYSSADATWQGCKPFTEPPGRAAGNHFPPPACKAAPRPGAPGGRDQAPHRRPPRIPPPPLPWALGFHRLHPFRDSTIRFYFNKSTRVNQAAAVKGHNSGETCPAFSASALRGISNVIQILSPLALHLFIYALGQQWPKSLLRSDSCLVVCATRRGAAGSSSRLLCPSSPQAP